MCQFIRHGVTQSEHKDIVRFIVSRGDQSPLLTIRRCASGNLTNQSALFVKVFSSSERAASRSVRGEIFVIFDGCDFVLGIIPRPEVLRIPYLSFG